MEEIILRGQKSFWDIKDGRYHCHITIARPFLFKGDWYFSLSDKLVDLCIFRKAIIHATVDGKEHEFFITKKGLKEKKKKGEFMEMKTQFENAPNWYLLLFRNL